MRKKLSTKQSVADGPDDLQPRHRLLLPPNLANLAKLSASSEQVRFGATTGIRLLSTKRGYRAEATDGRRAAILSGPMDNPDDYPAIPALDSAPNGEAVAVIPSDAWINGFKAVPKGRRIGVKPILGNLAAVLGKDRATLASTDLERVNVLQPRVVEGRFPNLDLVHPKGKPVATIRIDGKLLAEMLMVAATIPDEDAMRAVEIEVRGPTVPLVIRATNTKGQEFTGLIVPLAQEKKAEAHQPAESPAVPEPPKKKRVIRNAMQAVAACVGFVLVWAHWLLWGNGNGQG